MCEMYVYPIRGVRAGGQVEYIELGMHGVKYDREILLAAKEDKAIITTNKYHAMGCLRQVLKGSIVTVTTTEPQKLKAKNLPLSLTIDLDDEPDQVGPFIECQRDYQGYQFNETIAQWFSAAIDKEVFAIRSQLKRRTRGNPKRLLYDRHDDLRKTFCTDSAFHVVNKASVAELKKRMEDRHPDGLPNFFCSAEQFRPNVVLDWPIAFAEDEFFEMRVGPILMRNSGPCIRCNTIRMNLDNNVRVEDCEPYRTLSTFRNVTGLGILFGMYYQMDVLETDRLYRTSLPTLLGYKNKKLTDFYNPSTLREGDE